MRPFVIIRVSKLDNDQGEPIVLLRAMSHYSSGDLTKAVRTLYDLYPGYRLIFRDYQGWHEITHTDGLFIGMVAPPKSFITKSSDEFDNE